MNRFWREFLVRYLAGSLGGGQQGMLSHCCVTSHKIVLFIKAGVVTVPIMTAVCLGNDHPNAGSFTSRSGLAKYQGYPFILFETRADQHMARIAPLRGSVRGGLVLSPKSFPTQWGTTLASLFWCPGLGLGMGPKIGIANRLKVPCPRRG